MQRRRILLCNLRRRHRLHARILGQARLQIERDVVFGRHGAVGARRSDRVVGDVVDCGRAFGAGDGGEALDDGDGETAGHAGEGEAGGVVCYGAALGGYGDHLEEAEGRDVSWTAARRVCLRASG